MRRVVSVFLPTWPTDRFRRRHAHRAPPWDRPLVTVIQDGPRRVLASVDRAARDIGLRPGMPLAQAQASVPDLATTDATPGEDAQALTRLAAWCLRYSPLVAPDPRDGLWIDIAGSAHLFRGETGLLSDLFTRIERQGVTIRAAVADTPGAAWAVARFAQERVIPPGCQAAAIAELPVQALRLSPETVASLLQLGIERVGQLAAKPRAPLRLRFGDEVVRRLDQTLGHAPEAISYISPPDVPAARLAFAEPISAPETLQRVTERLLTHLCPDLERRAVGVRRLDLVFRRIDGLTQGVRIGTARPTRSVKHLMRLFAERLALVDPGFGIEEAHLIASSAEWFDPAQLGLAEDLGGDTADQSLSELVDRLHVRLGPGRVFRVQPVESELPERSVRRVSPVAALGDLAWPADLPRPARLLAPPEPVTAVAELPDHPPAFFVWRRVRFRVARADGPERVNGEWWVSNEDAGLVRDYYRVETPAGDRFWLFRDAPVSEGGRWWLHGIGEA